MDNKFDEIMNAIKVNELFHKKEVEDDKKNCVLTVLAIVGVVTLVAGIAVAVYKYLSRKDYDEYDDFDFDLRDIRLFYYAFYLMECRGCCNLVLIEFGDMMYFIYDPSGFATLESKFRNEREELLRKVSDLTNLLPVLVSNNPDYPF